MQWNPQKLSDLCSIQSGGTPRRDNVKFYTGGTIPWAKIADLETSDGFVIETGEYITCDAVDSIGGRIFPEGTILLAMYGSVGKVAVAGTSLSTNQAILGIQIENTRLLDASYLKWWLIGIRSKLESEARGVTQKNISATIVRDLSIPLPPLDEQRRIAAILNKADDISRKRKKSIALLNKLIYAIYDDTFGDISKYPLRILSDVCEFITKGTTPSSLQIREIPEPSDIPFLKVLHIQNDGKIDFDSKPSFISDEIHNGPFKRSKVYPEDILMNIVGPPLGKIGYVPMKFPEWNVNQAIAVFRTKEEVAPRYLFHTLRHKEILNKIIGLAVGIRQLNLSLDQCRKIEIPVPPLSVQKEFVVKIEKIFEAEELSSELSNQSDIFFKSCIQRAFRGEL